MSVVQTDSGRLVSLPIDLLVPNQFQPRKYFEPGAMVELAKSIEQHGLLQPIVVRPLTGDKFEIIAGERRWRAAQRIDLKTIKCLVHTFNDEQAAGVAMVENLIRADLNPIEEAEAYSRLIETFGYGHEDIALIIGQSRAKITNSLRLLKLMEPVRDLLIKQRITVGHAKILAGLPDSLQIVYANKCWQRRWSVRHLAGVVKNSSAQQPRIKQSFDQEKLESLLSEHMGCPVSLMDNEGKGKLIIQYYNLDTLEGIFSKLQFKFED